MFSNLFAASASENAKTLTCDDHLCIDPECSIHGPRRPATVVMREPCRLGTGELPSVDEQSTSTNDVWTNIALAAPSPIHAIPSFDGPSDGITMSGAVDAADLEKGNKGGQMIYATNGVP